MSRASRSVTAATAASLCLLAGGLVAISTTSSRSPGASPATSVTESTFELPTTLTTLTTLTTTSTENPGFVDGAAASVAAEQLLTPYIASQHLAEVTEPACSQPPTGAVGETFACYALKPDDLVIALRATIGAERLISLELITDQVATTTTTTTTTVPVEATGTTSA